MAQVMSHVSLNCPCPRPGLLSFIQGALCFQWGERVKNYSVDARCRCFQALQCPEREDVFVVQLHI